MINIRIDIEYDGTDFSGWQLQNNERTVQGEFEKILEDLYGKRIPVIGSGRTDAGVHALKQVANFRVPDKYDTDTLKNIFNAKLSDDIVVNSIQTVDSEFNARFSAKWRQYKYVFFKNRQAIQRSFGWYIPFKVDFDKIREASYELIGTRDYEVFSKADYEKEHFLVDIMEVNWTTTEENIIFRIKANRFLRNMVRNIVGMLVDIGRGKLTAEKMMELIEKKDKENYGFCAPPVGLFLENV